MAGVDAASLLRGARRSAGLTQRDLAGRAGVPQPTVARIESGVQEPRHETLDRLLRACGFELRLVPITTGEDANGVDREQIRQLLRLSPAERFQRAVAYGRLTRRLQAGDPQRRAGAAS